MSEDFGRVLVKVVRHVDLTLGYDESGDAAQAHYEQDCAAAIALRWIAANSSCSASMRLAKETVRALDSDGERWYA